MTVFTLLKSILDLYKEIKGSDLSEYPYRKDILDIMGVVFMTIMFIEMNIYLAYKKDIMFSIMTLIDFVGMYVYNNTWQNCSLDHNCDTNKFSDKYPYKDYVLTYIIVLISITSLFILVTMIHDWDKVFYLKYRLYYKSYES